MTPEQLVERLKQSHPQGLKSVVLYGSAAAGDHAGKRSDYNVLVVLERLSIDDLKQFFAPSQAWIKAGNPAPLLFTPTGLRSSADVFPIELLDIKDSHRVLFGEDPVSDLNVDMGDLRLQLEHELKGKLIQLRLRYLETGGKHKAVSELLIQSLASFLVLFRAALRLFQAEVPATKIEAVRQLSKYISFDPEVFVAVDALKSGAKKFGTSETDVQFQRYLGTIEEIVEAIDLHLPLRGGING